ncbi:2-oxoglutarate dehydrogenase complex dihydrolipoyllysine-residue succinyltransferase [Bartonella sp. TP]|uniref:2-oxoglutarate dehydrogenase complex dihydrolipoyllysine-residue succinyltransferase n=1 Tax=Bartonella sp. TP TaxID=3057550 RepID=UPI0025AEE68F|nr:2-oxoglutarate dehydrogenase complex dihydrolipoyllysine-residue succinyltransferase [Bartonella sp. TP]WJW79506.1 2-oxoglutarate dehydrogenase complex dihydrolipoyllysine-residue succinyltransferase [Bartonella sp. TP]
MAKEITVPTLGESVTEATIGKWFKQIGDNVAVDEPIVELETDKVTIEVPSPVAGKLTEHVAKEGDTVALGAILAYVEEGSAGNTAAPVPAAVISTPSAPAASAAMPASPAATKIMAENNLAAAQVEGSGKRGQILKGDVLDAMANKPQQAINSIANGPREERVRMTKLRQTIAKRLKEAQNIAAMLTTFNEVDMHAVMELRKRYKDVFEKKHGVKLGFMGFFTKAVCHALKELPAINAQIDGDDIVYKNYVNAGIAVGTPKGLVVPVVRDADQMSIAEIEKEIGRLGALARDGKLAVADMQGGSFTITNGGVYGSLMSTPILNAPQSGILGIHAVKERPVVIDGQIVIRPMMYLALSYDHRIVDGKEAVTFLVRVKESLEDPERLVLDL